MRGARALFELLSRFSTGQAELGIVTKFRDDVTLIGIKPLGHLASEGADFESLTIFPLLLVIGVVCIALTPCKDKPRVESNFFALPAKARGNLAHHASGIKHLIVKRKSWQGIQSAPASFCFFQLVARICAPTFSSSSYKGRPFQRDSVAFLSSRGSPIRG